MPTNPSDFIVPDQIDSRGIADPGAAGAVGSVNAMNNLLAARLMASKLAWAEKQYAAQQAQQQEQNAYERRRLDQGDARQAALDARTTRALDNAENKAQLAQVTQYPGSKISGAALESMGVGKDSPLRGTQFKNLQEALGGKFLTGMSGTAGTPQQSQGQITETPHAAVGPDMYEVRPSFTEEMKTTANELATRKADLQQSAQDLRDKIASERNDMMREHYQQMLDVTNQRLAAANDRRNNPTAFQQFGMVDRLNKTYSTNTKAAREVARQYQVMQGAWNGLQQGIGKGTAEQGIVATFNKVLDPSSVVREGEYDRTAQGQALLQRMGTIADNLRRGGQVNPQVLQDMVTLAGTYAKQATAYANAEKARVGKMADAYGLPRDLIFMDDPTLDTAAGGAPGATPPGTRPAARKYDILDVKP